MFDELPALPPPASLDAELNLVARSILASRHRDIPVPLLGDLIVNDDALRTEYQALVDELRPAARSRRNVFQLLLRYGQRSINNGHE